MHINDQRKLNIIEICEYLYQMQRGINSPSSATALDATWPITSPEGIAYVFDSIEHGKPCMVFYKDSKSGLLAHTGLIDGCWYSETQGYCFSTMDVNAFREGLICVSADEFSLVYAGIPGDYSDCYVVTYIPIKLGDSIYIFD